MHFTYRCHGKKGMNPCIWCGEITLLKDSEIIETDVTARGSSFHMLVGKYQYGNFICIPDWGIGTELSHLSDRFWNLERLTCTYPKLSLVEAISIADALVELSHHCSL